MIRGMTEPRVFTPPKARKLDGTNTLGYALVEFAREILDVDLLPWEEWLAVHALELNESGGFRFRTIVVLVARQNGKSLFGEILALFFMYVLNVDLIVGTAQSLEIAEEIWDGAVDMAESNDELKSRIVAVSRRNGGKALKIDTGRYKIAAASRKGGRGLSSDLILLDELREHVNWDSWGAVTKSAMARPNALVWCMSNAGDAQSVVLRHLRTQAHAAAGDPDGVAERIGDLIASPEGDDVFDDDTLGIFEWSADPDLPITSKTAWRQANPSLGYGFMTERALASACATDPEAVFRTECLCQWVEATIEPPFPAGSWDAGVDESSAIADGEPLWFGIDMSDDRTTTSLAVCGMRDDGYYHAEVIAHRTGFDWALEWLRKRASQEDVYISCQGRGAPISAYAAFIEGIDNVHLVKCEGRDLGAWTGRFYDSVVACADEAESDAVPVMHRPQPVMDTAARVAQRKYIGDGAFCFDRRNSVENVAPLVAAVMAYGLASGGAGEDGYYPSAYASDRDVLFV